MESDTEIFSDRRMKKCENIVNNIIESSAMENRFTGVFQACDSVAGIGIPELRKLYFSVYDGTSKTEIPFHDMLVVIALFVHQYTAAVNRQHPNDPDPELVLPTSFPDSEVARLLDAVIVQAQDGTRIRLSGGPSHRP